MPWLLTDDPTPLVYVHADPLGSTWLVTEGKASAIHAGIRYTQGQIVQRYTYGPFGATRFVLNPNLGAPTPAHAALLTTPAYTGHRALPGVGLLDAHARDLDPTWGRFLTPDPVVADPTDAQAYNRYAYARNNPFRYTDPTGWEWELIDAQENVYTEETAPIQVTIGPWTDDREVEGDPSAANLVGATVDARPAGQALRNAMLGRNFRVRHTLWKLPGTSYPVQRPDLTRGCRRAWAKCPSPPGTRAPRGS